MNRISGFAWAAGLSLAGSIVVRADASLENVVVTASRVEQPISEVIGSVTVITRKDIEERQAQSVQDLLRGEAGIDVANTGGLGKQSSLFMRGANSNHTLILIDGVRVGSAADGTTRLEYIPVDQIERIEIVRGPRSSLYGPDAIGGVIQIFTRNNNGIHASAGFSTYQTQTYSAGLGLKQDALSFSVEGGYQDSNGFNSCSGDPLTYAGCSVLEPDNDGYRNSNATGRISYDFGKASVELSTLYTKGLTEYDGSSRNQTRFITSTPAAKLVFNATQTLNFTLQGGITRQDSTDYKNSVFTATRNAEKRNAGVQMDWSFAKEQTLTIGTDYLRDHLDDTIQYVINSRINKGYYAQYLGRFSDHELSAALRHDKNEQFGSYNTGSVGWKWFVMGEAMAINAGVGRAFHAPTFGELYYPFGFGNPNLKPERSRSVELGVSGRQSVWHWSAQAYQTDASDLIAADSNYVLRNLATARLRGLELMTDIRWNRLFAALNYTFQNPVDRSSGDNFNTLLLRRARQSGRIDVSYDVGKVKLGGSLNFNGVRHDYAAYPNTTRLPSYATLDIKADMQLSKQFCLQMKVGNVFDRDYQAVYLYNQPGRTLGVTLSYAQ